MKEKGAVGWAVLAAALYAVSTPVSKLLLREVAPAMLAALLYLGAGIGMLGMGMARGRRGSMRRGRRLCVAVQANRARRIPVAPHSTGDAKPELAGVSVAHRGAFGGSAQSQQACFALRSVRVSFPQKIRRFLQRNHQNF